MAAWTRSENKLFEQGIADFDHESPHFFENIRLMLPNKTIPDIQQHYQELKRDLAMIEWGLYDHVLPPMIPLDQNIPIMDQESKKKVKSDGKWSDEEQRMFQLGLEMSNKAKSSRGVTVFIPDDASSPEGSHSVPSPDDQH